jgi:hypothetical protein
VNRPALAPSGPFRFYGYMVSLLDGYLGNWELSIRTLPDRQLEAELAELRAGCRPGEVGAVEMIAALYANEAERRGSR